MDNFNMKQWLQENKTGPYSKVLLNEEVQETVGYANITKPADNAPEAPLEVYKDKLKKHDWHYSKSDDPRTYDRGVAQEAELRNLYNNLSDVDKEAALDAYKEVVKRIYPAGEFPLMATRVGGLTTKTFTGV